MQSIKCTFSFKLCIASIFAYGQTGSGKTYSMIGTDSEPGLIPRFLDNLFATKQERERSGIASSIQIEISYYEIYNEKIYDLLGCAPSVASDKSAAKRQHPGLALGNASGSSQSKYLAVREDREKGPIIVDLQTISVNTAADAK